MNNLIKVILAALLTLQINLARASFTDYNSLEMGKNETLPTDRNYMISIDGKNLLLTVDGKTFNSAYLPIFIISSLNSRQISKLQHKLRIFFNNEQLSRFVIRKLILSAERLYDLKAIENMELLAQPLINLDDSFHRNIYNSCFSLLKQKFNV